MASSYKSDKWYYIGDDGQEYGPFTTNQMQHMAGGGKGKGMRQIQNKLAR